MNGQIDQWKNSYDIRPCCKCCFLTAIKLNLYCVLCYITTNMCSLQSYLRNGRLDIQESTQSVPVTIVPTVPISCPPCSITVNIANPVGLTVSQCSMTFSASDPPMTDHTINIRAVPTAGTNSRVARLQFRPVESFISGSAWDNHTITSIPVSTTVFLASVYQSCAKYLTCVFGKS